MPKCYQKAALQNHQLHLELCQPAVALLYFQAFRAQEPFFLYPFASKANCPGKIPGQLYYIIRLPGRSDGLRFRNCFRPNLILPKDPDCNDDVQGKEYELTK